MNSVTIIGVDLQSLMQILQMLQHINVPFESNIGNVVVITADSQIIVEFIDCRLIGNQGTHYYQAHITISILNSNYTISATLRLVNNTANFRRLHSIDKHSHYDS